MLTKEEKIYISYVKSEKELRDPLIFTNENSVAQKVDSTCPIHHITSHKCTPILIKVKSILFSLKN